MLARCLIDLLTLSTTSDHRYLLISTSITYRIHTIVVLFDFTRDNHDGAHTREIERVELISLALVVYDSQYEDKIQYRLNSVNVVREEDRSDCAEIQLNLVRQRAARRSLIERCLAEQDALPQYALLSPS